MLLERNMNIQPLELIHQQRVTAMTLEMFLLLHPNVCLIFIRKFIISTQYPHNSGGDDDEPSNKDWTPQKPVTLLKKKEPQMEQKPDEN
jgi:hypothetical protein